MKQSRRIALIVLVALPVLGALLGRLAAPQLARMNTIVRLAENVWKDEGGGKHGRADAHYVADFQSLGVPASQIYLQAGEVRRAFNTGSAWFGLWCGLVAALKIASLLAWRRRRDYDADPAHCLACARCYRACPVERERLDREIKEQPL